MTTSDPRVVGDPFAAILEVTSVIVTIHQPNFMPWLGFFDKLAAADCFILLDNVGFEKGGYQNRVQVKGPNGPHWLTAPVKTAGKLGQPISEVLLDGDQWQRKHKAVLEGFYGRTPGFSEQLAWLDALWEERAERLLDFSRGAIVALARALNVATPTMLASDLGATGSRSILLADLVERAGGDVYLSGPAGRDYLNEREFWDRGIQVRYHEFRGFEYAQRYGPFIGGLSAFDYLCNEPSLELWRTRPTVAATRAFGDTADAFAAVPA
jgi:hypothetical protein